MEKWTHKATWPGCGDKDRLVLIDGKRAGRVYHLKHGPQAGSWQWSGAWMGPDHHGVVAGFDDALEAVRSGYIKIQETDPGRLVECNRNRGESSKTGVIG